MKDFRLFDIYDFVMDEDFIRWVKSPEQADHDFWSNWLMQNPDKHIVTLEARMILQSISIDLKTTSAEEKNAEVEKLLATIDVKSIQQIPAHENSRRIPGWWSIAAVVVFMVGSIFLIRMLKNNDHGVKYAFRNSIPAINLSESVNTSGKPVNIKLPDGSMIELSPDSRIAYASNFDSAQTRDVYLSGEAFFEVNKNPRRPFRVFANEIVTKVLGTSFRVRSFEKDSAISVVVRTGKVSVYSQSSSDIKETATPASLGGIILTPNQELVYQKSLQKFQRVLMDNPVMVLPAEQDKTLLYEDAPLINVFTQLTNNYGINIVYDTEALKTCTITADLRNIPFYEKLALMCKAIGGKYEIIDGQVVIQANGCG